MANGFGDVYIFNLYVSDITKISLNGQNSAGAINAPSPVSPIPYEPRQLMVSRTNLNANQLNSSLFVQGDNTVTVDYFGQSWTTTITISDQTKTSLQNDLSLYICYQTAWLLDTFGNWRNFYSERSMKVVGGKEIVSYGYHGPLYAWIDLDR